MEKKRITDLAAFGGKPIFSYVRSISNLVRPDFNTFIKYLKKSYINRQMTDNGCLVKELEDRLKEVHNVNHCVTFCNGLWGIVLCMKQLAIEGKSEVVMPSMTYRRLGDIAAWVGLTPHYCDINKEVLGATPETVEPCINENTALLLIPQPIVNICDMEGITSLAERHQLPIIFDSVEGAYASYKGKMLGGFGNVECFSMHASKLINGFEGGYMTTNDSNLADIIKKMSCFGMADNGKVEYPGLNAKLNEIHAAMTIACLDDLDDQIKRNKKRYHQYKTLLESVEGMDLVNYDESEKRGYKNILVKINEKWPISRQDTINLMHAENMLVRPYYYPPLHVKKTEYRTIHKELSISQMVTEQYMLLPSGEFVTCDDIAKIFSLLKFIQDSGEKLQMKLNNENNN